MLNNRLCFPLVGLCIIFCSTASAQLSTTQTVEQMHAHAEGLFLMPLKATYQEETYTYYLPSEIVERLSDGKVIVEEESTRTTLIDPATGETRDIFLTREGLYDPAIDMAVRHYAADTVLYLCDKRYRLEQHDAEEGMIGATVWNGTFGTEKLGTCTRPEIRLGYYRSEAGPEGIVSPLLMAYQRNTIPNAESCALERAGDLYKLTCIRSGSILEYWFDPHKNYIIKRFRLRVGDWVWEESTVSNIVQVADLYLPGDVEYTRYFVRGGRVRFHYRASNIAWELVEDIDKKFIVTREERQRLDTYTRREK